MSQAIQHNSEVTMTRHEDFLRAAEALRPALSSRAYPPQAVIDAHPSPTPAADADRVRIAVEAFNAKINAPLTGPTHGAWDRGRSAGLKEALAALKSTAAKEGGAA